MFTTVWYNDSFELSKLQNGYLAETLEFSILGLFFFVIVGMKLLEWDHANTRRLYSNIYTKSSF